MGYIEKTDIIDVKTTVLPARGQTVSGYGDRLPTRFLIKLRQDNRWHRVSVSCYSNAGFVYVMIDRERFGCETALDGYMAGFPPNR